MPEAKKSEKIKAFGTFVFEINILFSENVAFFLLFDCKISNITYSQKGEKKLSFQKDIYKFRKIFIKK